MGRWEGLACLCSSALSWPAISKALRISERRWMSASQSSPAGICPRRAHAKTGAPEAGGGARTHAVDGASFHSSLDTAGTSRDMKSHSLTAAGFCACVLQHLLMKRSRKYIACIEMGVIAPPPPASRFLAPKPPQNGVVQTFKQDSTASESHASEGVAFQKFMHRLAVYSVCLRPPFASI